MKATEFAEECGGDCEQDASGEHLRAGTHHFFGRQREHAGKGGGDRPTDSGEDEGAGAGSVDRAVAEAEAVAYEDGNASDADEQSDGEAWSEALGAEDENLG